MKTNTIVGYSLSPQQKRAWISQHSQGAKWIYSGLHLKGQVDVKKLIKAIKNTVQRNEILRTQFEKSDEIAFPLQIVTEHITDVEVVDLATEQIDEKHAFQLGTELIAQKNGRTTNTEFCLLTLNNESHIVVLGLSPMLGDAQSSALIFQEISEIYIDLLDKNAPVTQYLQYTEWKNETDNETQDLLTPSPRPVPQSLHATLPNEQSNTNNEGRCAITSYSFKVEQKTRNIIDQLSIDFETQSINIWISFLLIWISRACQQKTVSIDYLFNGRIFDELEKAIGPYSYDAHLPVQIFDEDTTADIIEQVSGLIEQMSMGKIDVDDYVPIHSSEKILVESVHSSLPVTDQLLLKQIENHEQQDIFKLKFSIHYNAKINDVVTIHFDQNRYDESDMVRLYQGLLHLIHGAHADLKTAVSELSVQDPATSDRLLYTYNDTYSPVPDGTIVDWIDARCNNNKATAIISDTEELSFANLQASSNQLAHFLLSKGVAAESKVVLYLNKQLKTVPIILGILKAGATYVPIDPMNPISRVNHILQDCQPQFVICDGQTAKKLNTSDYSVIDIESISNEVETYSITRPNSISYPYNSAYIIYTSGSTGTPKGVVNSHKNIANYLHWAKNYYLAENSTGTLLHSSLAFDMSITSLFLPLICGRPTRIIDNSGNIDSLIKTISESSDLSFIKLTPSHLHLMTSRLSLDKREQTQCLILGGEALLKEHIESFIQQPSSPRVINEYGPTEATVGCCIYEISRQQAIKTNVPIGHPIDNPRLYVLDQGLVPAVLGSIGELFISGEGLARGYYGNPALTAEKFIPNPFSPNPGERMYRTGDAVRFIDEQNLEYTGRLDEQVKIHGYRIEPGEVEAALLTHDCIADAAVITELNTAEEPDLVAALVYQSDVSLNDIRDFLLTQLPDYMIPSRFVSMHALPINQNGKVDKQQLKTLCNEADYIRSKYQPPQTTTQELLADLWREVLDQSKVGIDDNFFLIGGDSIKSIRFRVLAEKHGLAVSNEMIFSHQTIRTLSKQLEQQSFISAADLEPLAPFALLSPELRKQVPHGITDSFPLATLQKGMIFHSQLDVDSGVFHDIISVELRLPFEQSILQHALDQLLNDHHMLRSSIDLNHFDEPLILIHESLSAPLEVLDIRALSEDVQKKTLASWLEKEKVRNFEWSVAPLLKFVLHRISDTVCRFSFCFHHSILDGWSVANLLAELFKNYFALLNGAQITSQRETLSYSNFVKLEQQAIQSEQTAVFWQTLLDDCEATLLPVGKYQKNGALTNRVEISQQTSKSLIALSKSLSIPVKNILLTAHLKVISYFAGSDDVVTGIISNGRVDFEGGDSLAGLFVNTLPFRAKVNDSKWENLIKDISSLADSIVPHRRLPLANILRNAGRPVLFNSCFNFMHFHVYQSLENVGDSEVLDWGGYEEVDFPLMATFSLDLEDGHIVLDLNCNQNQISGKQMTDFTTAYLNVLESIANYPEQSVAECQLLAETDRHTMLYEWNDTATEYAALNETLHECIARQSQHSPNAIALSFENSNLTYSQLMSHSEALAHKLIANGVTPHSIVAICFERSLEMVVAQLAVMRAGAAYLPIDPQVPDQRLNYMLDDSQPTLLLVAKELKDLQDRVKTIPVVVLPSLPATCEQKFASPLPQVSPDAAAYVIYTSGSTGQPKGVLVPHRGIVNQLQWMQSCFPLDHEDRAIQKAPYTFDLSMWEFFWPLIAGAELIIAGPQGHKDPTYLANLIREKDITTLCFVPSMLTIFLQTEGINELTALRQVFCIGEALSPTVVKQFYERFDVPLHNLYGPTEASVSVSHWPCSAEPEVMSVPIGKPAANTQLYILNSRMQPQPAGAVGELYIGGTGLAHGYIGQSAITADRFLPNPFSHTAGNRIYRTGDRARFNEDGSIEYIDRIDNQVKIRGLRIEPGEIDNAIISVPDVRQVATIPYQQNGYSVLVAWIVPEENVQLDLTALRQFLQGCLPDYMIPSYFELIESLPLNSNGKLDRKALPSPTLTSRASSQPYVPARNPVEQTLVDIWQSVLQLERVGVHDNFFEIGGHSLVAIQIFTRLKTELQVDLPLYLLFEHSTIAELVLQLETFKQQGNSVLNNMIVPRRELISTLKSDDDFSVDDLLDELEDMDESDVRSSFESTVSLQRNINPLTHDQERVWELELHNDRRFRYTVSFMYRLLGPLNKTDLRDSLSTIVSRHEALRSTFETIDGQAVQIVHQSLNIPFEEIDLSQFNQKETELQRLSAKISREQFDLKSGPLFRCILYKMSDGEQVLFIIAHALIMDNLSTGILLQELITLYEGKRNQQLVVLPDLNIQVADFAHWEKTWVSNNEDLLSYWMDKLQGPLEPVHLPGRADVATPSNRGSIQTISLSDTLTRKIKAATQTHSITNFMLTLSAFKLLLHKYSGDKSICLGIGISSRYKKEIEPLIGCFMNILLLQTDVSGDVAFTGILKRVRDVILGAFAHQAMPLNRLMAALKEDNRIPGALPTRIMADHLTTTEDSPTIGELKITPVLPELQEHVTGSDITFRLHEHPNGLNITIFHNLDLYSESVIQALLDEYQTLLEALLDNPDQPISGVINSQSEV